MQSMDIVDARGLLCPLPVVRVQNHMRKLPSGATLKVLATDPGAKEDIPAWCRIHGHQLLGIRTQDEIIEISIAKATT